MLTIHYSFVKMMTVLMNPEFENICAIKSQLFFCFLVCMCASWSIRLPISSLFPAFPLSIFYVALPIQAAWTCCWSECVGPTTPSTTRCCSMESLQALSYLKLSVSLFPGPFTWFNTLWHFKGHVGYLYAPEQWYNKCCNIIWLSYAYSLYITCI